MNFHGCKPLIIYRMNENIRCSRPRRVLIELKVCDTVFYLYAPISEKFGKVVEFRVDKVNADVGGWSKRTILKRRLALVASDLQILLLYMVKLTTGMIQLGFSQLSTFFCQPLSQHLQQKLLSQRYLCRPFFCINQ